MPTNYVELRYYPNPKTLTVNIILWHWLKNPDNASKVPTFTVTAAEHDLLEKTGKTLTLGNNSSYLITGTDQEIWRLRVSENQLEYPTSEEPGPREHIKL